MSSPATAGPISRPELNDALLSATAFANSPWADHLRDERLPSRVVDGQREPWISAST